MRLTLLRLTVFALNFYHYTNFYQYTNNTITHTRHYNDTQNRHYTIVTFLSTEVYHDTSW